MSDSPSASRRRRSSHVVLGTMTAAAVLASAVPVLLGDRSNAATRTSNATTTTHKVTATSKASTKATTASKRVSADAPLTDPTKNFLAFLADPRMESAGNGTFSTFLRLVNAANMKLIFNGPGPMTVFAPTDEAFARKFTPKQLDVLVRNPLDAARLVNFHVANGGWPVSKAQFGTIPTIEGNELHGSKGADGILRINGSAVRAAAIVVKNGWVYAVNDVLLPPSFLLPGGS